MKKLIAVVLVLGIVFSMFSVTAISTAAASAPSAEATADSAESVGAPPSNADEYSEIGLGESTTETALIKRKFTASKPMIVKLTATGSKVYTVNVAGETQTPNYFDYTTNENGKEYYYGLKANETIYITCATYNYHWYEPSEEQIVDISLLVEECTEWTELSMDSTAEYNYDENTGRYYFYFVAPEDMHAILNYFPDGKTNTWIKSATGTSPVERNYSSLGTKKKAALCTFTAGNIYMVMCEYSPGYREQKTPGTMRVWLEKTGSISVGDTKEISLSDAHYVNALIFTPERDMFIKYYPNSFSDNGSTFYNALNTIPDNYNNISATESNNPIIAKVTAGEKYVLSNYYDNFGMGSSEVTLEEYTPRDIAVNETVTAQVSKGGMDYFRLVPDRDTDVIIKTYDSRISLKNADMESATPLNGTGNVYSFFRLLKGETYYIVATGANTPLEFCINEIVPKKISLNESNPSAGTEDGQYYFYEFTPDEDVVVSVYFPTNTHYSVSVYTPDWDNLSASRMFTRDDFSYDMDELTDELVGKEEYFLLSKGNTYIFALYSYLSYWGDNLTADFKLKPVEFKDITLNEYQSLYTHVSNEYLFFRYTPEETGFVKSKITKDEDDTRNIVFNLLNTDYEPVNNTLSENPVLVEKDKTYYFLGKASFDLYCDDLDCGATLVRPEIKPIKEGETLELNHGEIARFSPDKQMIVKFQADYNTDFELYDGDLNLLESSVAENRGKMRLVNPGETYYFLNKKSSSDSKELTVKLTSYPETLELNREYTVDIDETNPNRYFFFTPEADMTVEYYGYLSEEQDDHDIRPIGVVWNDTYSNYDSFRDYNSFSAIIEAKAGKTILLSTSLSSSGDNEGIFTIGLRNDNTIALNETREIKSDGDNHAEKSFFFSAEENMLIQCTASSNYIDVTGATVQVTDSDGTVLAENDSTDKYNVKAAVTVEVEKGKTYNITTSFDAEDSSFEGTLRVTAIRDLHLGDKITENGTYRFVPDKDVYPVIKVTTDDNTVFYDSVTVMNEDFNYLRPFNDFGGDYFAVRKGNTYYIGPTSDFRDWISEGYEVEFCEPETINPGETKPAFVPGQRDWLYQITCDEDTIVKFTGTGEGSIIAFLRDSYGDVLRNNYGGEDALFSFGYTLNAGEKYLVVINAYDDTDIQVTARIPDEFEIVDNVLVKYYGNKANPSIPNVRAIGDSAFLYSDNLQTLIVPDSVTEIGDASFARCYALTKAVVPGSVSAIAPRAFDFDVELNDLTLGEGITEIGEGAFEVCIKLSEVKLPQTLTKIGNNAFLGCSALNKITIPKSVTSIGNYALGYDENYNGLSKKESFIIRGYKDTAAEQYALDNGFTFIDLDNSEPTPDVKIGDVNNDGSIDITDATMIQKAVAELIELDNNQIKAADTNNDGNVDVTDATAIQKYIAEIIDHF